MLSCMLLGNFPVQQGTSIVGYSGTLLPSQVHDLACAYPVTRVALQTNGSSWSLLMQSLAYNCRPKP